jgi:UDP-2,3-diacylglucosamine hydrolase
MGEPPFPAPDTFHAPPSWRCIDFISDLHLHEALPRTTAALAAYLRETPADAIFILGDLFEAWVGDDMRTQPYEAQCTAMLAEAGHRLHLGIMVGNRDFLLGPEMLAACHAHHLADPTVLTAFGQRTLLIHGDELCLADEAYLRFRAQVRQPGWQRPFLAAPLDARLAQAKQMREASQAHQQSLQARGAQPSNEVAAAGSPAPMWDDINEAAAGLWMQSAQATRLIHGHTHHPQDQAFGIPGGMRHVLSDWDLDHGPTRGEVLRFTAQGLQRVPLKPA